LAGATKYRTGNIGQYTKFCASNIGAYTKCCDAYIDSVSTRKVSKLINSLQYNVVHNVYYITAGVDNRAVVATTTFRHGVAVVTLSCNVKYDVTSSSAYY